MKKKETENTDKTAGIVTTEVKEKEVAVASLFEVGKNYCNLSRVNNIL